MAEKFEQMRYVMHHRFPAFKLEGNAPFTIVAIRSEVSFAHLQPLVHHSDTIGAVGTNP